MLQEDAPENRKQNARHDVWKCKAGGAKLLKCAKTNHSCLRILQLNLQIVQGMQLHLQDKKIPEILRSSTSETEVSKGRFGSFGTSASIAAPFYRSIRWHSVSYSTRFY
jgi:hypothetical protein